jgi:hypothetical protein
MVKDEEYGKVYLNCMYRARKLIVQRYEKEYRAVLNELLLEQGIVPRSMRNELLEMYQTRGKTNE